MDYYGWIVFAHAITAAAFVMTMIIMQLVVANVMKRIPDSSGKKEGVSFIQKRWLPIVDAIIIVLGLTAIGIASLNFDMIISSSIFLTKIIIGIVALGAAYCNHFYLRYVKRELAASGRDPDRLKKIGRIMPVLDKVALIGGVITAVIGWYINHV
tara:strand:- start:1199 stop:1663 length:465 start_codon:yes stop_codon:yes gene_type:complete